MIRIAYLIPAIFLVCLTSGWAQTTYVFQGERIPSGSKKHLLVPIETPQGEVKLPVTVFNGSKDGKTLGITAGVHGYEYPPIMAGQQLINSIKPQELTGVVLLVHLANPKSFLGRSPFVNPVDAKNLNRSFPGNPSGSMTEQIAAWLSTQIIAKSDYFLDMHGGDASEDLIPYIAYYNHEKHPKASTTGKHMAQAMGYDWVVRFNTAGKAYMQADQPSLYCSAEAFKQGIPAIDIECGHLGKAEQGFTDKIEASVLLLLEHLQMQETSITKPTSAPYTIRNRVYTEATQSGIFYPSKKAGEYVKAGMKIGHITNFFGETIEEVYAKEEGILLLIIGTPPVNKGETLAVIGKLE